MRDEEQPIKPVGLNELLSNVESFHKDEYRIVQICCTKLAENSFELTYSFDKDYKFLNIRISVTSETEIPSITGIYGGAFLYENEINELFGMKIKGINVDYKGNFYKKKIQAPFSAPSRVDDSCQKGQ